MPVGRCSSKLSGHELQAKSKKSQAPSAAEGSAVRRTIPGNVFRQSAAYWRDLLFSLHDPTTQLA
jgi:hypothetical protein